jgi:hypothetical protein
MFTFGGFGPISGGDRACWCELERVVATRWGTSLSWSGPGLPASSGPTAPLLGGPRERGVMEVRPALS